MVARCRNYLFRYAHSKVAQLLGRRQHVAQTRLAASKDQVSRKIGEMPHDVARLLCCILAMFVDKI